MAGNGCFLLMASLLTLSGLLRCKINTEYMELSQLMINYLASTFQKAHLQQEAFFVANTDGLQNVKGQLLLQELSMTTSTISNRTNA